MRTASRIGFLRNRPRLLPRRIAAVRSVLLPRSFYYFHAYSGADHESHCFAHDGTHHISGGRKRVARGWPGRAERWGTNNDWVECDGYDHGRKFGTLTSVTAKGILERLGDLSNSHVFSIRGNTFLHNNVSVLDYQKN